RGALPHLARRQEPPAHRDRQRPQAGPADARARWRGRRHRDHEGRCTVSERRTIDSALAGSTLTGAQPGVEYRPVAVMPDVRVVKIGGQSILDRGRAALFPILDEVIEARKKGIQVVLLTGGGTRARHIYTIASELEMPTGVVATLGKYIPM